MEHNKTRWTLGKNRIEWNVSQDTECPHEDHLEMSGKQVSMIVYYGVDADRNLTLSRKIIWPSLRTIPNDTHGSLAYDFKHEWMPVIKINGSKISNEKPLHIQFDGLLHIQSAVDDLLILERTLFPSTDTKAAVEMVRLQNTTRKEMTVEMDSTFAGTSIKGASGIYLINVEHNAPLELKLEPNESIEFSVMIIAQHLKEAKTDLDAEAEKKKRLGLVEDIGKRLQLETPNAEINQMFAFAKLRTAESIFETKNGPMHSPGGGHYYAGVWTNDQIEYAGPLFPYLGYPFGNEATLNALRLFTSFMGPHFLSIPSSIIAEGTDIWEKAGDRGDAAMYAYGATLFALSLGDPETAKELWPAVEWCLTYCSKHKNGDNVIASHTDELEGRFPTGSANLSTSCLTYAAYLQAADLAGALGKPVAREAYQALAEELYDAIENHFGATVEGFETYRYHEGNDVLRSWICIPLVVGINIRKTGTIQALLSPRLWSDNGLATQAGDSTFWDRSTLYGLRGVFAAGEQEFAAEYLISYSRQRLLGEHVPYAVEAYPEGNQRHLSAESALYCRIITEGLFGIQPTGLSGFSCTPRLPEGWNTMALRSIRAFGRNFDLVVNAHPSGIELVVADEHGSRHYVGNHSTVFEVRW